jgi:hypothetical protein
MTLAIGWLHEAGDPAHPHLRGGSMTLAIGWLHDGGDHRGTWLHEAGDWHLRPQRADWGGRQEKSATVGRTRHQRSRSAPFASRPPRLPPR